MAWGSVSGGGGECSIITKNFSVEREDIHQLVMAHINKVFCNYLILKHLWTNNQITFARTEKLKTMNVCQVLEGFQVGQRNIER